MSIVTLLTATAVSALSPTVFLLSLELLGAFFFIVYALCVFFILGLTV